MMIEIKLQHDLNYWDSNNNGRKTLKGESSFLARWLQTPARWSPTKVVRSGGDSFYGEGFSKYCMLLSRSCRKDGRRDEKERIEMV